MVDYSNACIYKLVCKDSDVKDIYVGSTVNFKSRCRQHKYTCNTILNKDYNTKVYKYIRENGGWENWKMVKICDVKPCLDNYDKIHAEQKYCDELKPKLNSLNPIHDVIKYKSIKVAYNKEYRLKNLDKIKLWHKQYNKAYQEKNKEELKIYRKAYLEKNRDLINKKRREKNRDKAYREKNRDRINKQRRERYAKKKLISSVHLQSSTGSG